MTRDVAAAPIIPPERGRIVNIIANVARGFPGMAHTGAARAGVENLTEDARRRVGGVRHPGQRVAPGIIRSSGTDRTRPSSLRRPSANARQAPRDAGRSRELCVYMASDAASFVTGETWYIDGGAHLWGDMWPIGETAAQARVPDVIEKLPRP